ncbi:serine protease [Dyella sp. SG562]|uniref:S8 family serine peptidase n=1 Tax=Dyella TaxID=231454 RepID=UPI00141E6E0F|nr:MULTISPECIES: S8 family serine peptidase [unclassified Dyella]NII72685.1 serine protease [Dyella sp. SG562]NKJ21788.1 serine protease [Dyella sp. SG609]
MNRSHMKLLAASLALALGLPAAAMAADDIAGNTRFDLSSVQETATYDRFVVVYRDGSTERGNAGAAVQAMSAAAGKAKLVDAVQFGGRALGLNYKRKLASGGDLVTTSRRLNAAETRQFVQQIAADPAVEFVQPDYLRQALDKPSKVVLPQGAATFTTPNDQYFAGYQWDYLAAGGAAFADASLGTSVANWGGANIKQAWTLADGTGVIIASLDTGVTNHPDLDLTLANAGYDFTSTALVSGRSTDGRVAGGWDTGDWTTGSKYLASNGGCVDSTHPAEDSSWHGTHVFGTAGGEKTNNTTGMVGTAFGAKVLPVRVLGHCGGYDSDIADAITWASGGHVNGVPDNANPAKVISMSLGGSGTCTSSSVTGKAISGAISRGATVVVAAGNSNANVSGFSPASCPGVVAVAATGITSRRAFYSNYGKGITLAAPGGGVYANDGSSGTQATTGFIWSTIDSGTTTPSGSTYGGMAGTSQATPHVAGAVALMQSYRLSLGKSLLSSTQIASLLKSSASAPHVAASGSKPIGAGILNAYAAVQAAGAQP